VKKAASRTLAKERKAGGHHRFFVGETKKDEGEI